MRCSIRVATMATLALGAAFASAQSYVYLNTSRGLGQTMHQVIGSVNRDVFAGDFLGLDAEVGATHFYCLTPERTLVEPFWFRRTLVKSYNGVWAGSLIAALRVANETNITAAGRQVGLWLANGVAQTYTGANQTAILAHANSVQNSSFNSTTARAFWLYEPVVWDPNGKVWKDDGSNQVLASEAVPEPMTLALAAAGLASALGRRRRR